MTREPDVTDGVVLLNTRAVEGSGVPVVAVHTITVDPEDLWILAALGPAATVDTIARVKRAADARIAAAVRAERARAKTLADRVGNEWARGEHDRDAPTVIAVMGACERIADEIGSGEGE